MNASRGRDAALIAALLVFAAALSPPARPFLREAAYRLGVLSTPRPLERGKPLGEISLVALDGSKVFVRPRPGHALLINVFATWCPPCQAETPLLVSVAPSLERSGVDVVGVDQADSISQVERFTSAFAVPYPVYVDQNWTTKITLDARVIPTTLLVDRRDIVRYVHSGPLDSSDLLAMSKAARNI
ncbi:MAG: TlpA family protein disulfide reductase [Candidatus Eremiobacteraeota bacterium]|nr:TlpA family protein disulfide reductase [Candidatus Eremiobacteraeota bacterium]